MNKYKSFFEIEKRVNTKWKHIKCTILLIQMLNLIKMKPFLIYKSVKQVNLT
ncbi:hypothetical protein BMB171_C4639 [Bacillus thuringiensis BMB171]|nr:hypothetical protein BMB171_C4639 [Bacillus thuringiensis BMB171]